MERAAANWRYQTLHEAKPFHDGTFTSWSEKRSMTHPYHHSDGVTVWVATTDLTAHDHFLGGAADCHDCTGGGPSQPDESV